MGGVCVTQALGFQTGCQRMSSVQVFGYNMIGSVKNQFKVMRRTLKEKKECTCPAFSSAVLNLWKKGVDLTVWMAPK